MEMPILQLSSQFNFPPSRLHAWNSSQKFFRLADHFLIDANFGGILALVEDAGRACVDPMIYR